ncbi:unnamed protein product [Cyclocybe aegerita]|uniref:Uncharacterized protein n=1 Tax=Cyclocybe aegerita TaxID=1973307 RepID=A0A8S0X0C3_CYCAE|nr:unnamed protein product [Cyclocybe aegerita]
MGRHSKATTARLGNLNHPRRSYKPTVEDVSESEDEDYIPTSNRQPLLEEGFFFLDEDLDSDSDWDPEDEEEVEVDEEELEGLKNESNIHQFAAVLCEAQALAVKAEREAAADKPNRPKHYTGNSKQSQRLHAFNRKKLAAAGQQFINSWFTVAKKTVSEDESGSDSDSSPEDPPTEDVEASMGWLFPERDELSNEMNPGPLHDTTGTQSDTRVRSAKEEVEELLKQLWNGCRPSDDSPETRTDVLLNGLCYKDFPMLRRALAKLTVKSKDKKLDVFFRSRITGMVATLNLYLDSQLSYTWREASLIAAKAAGRGPNHARNLRKWICQFLKSGKLPLHRYGSYNSSILDDEDFAWDIQLHLTEKAKDGYIRAQDIVDYVATKDVQERLGVKARGITVRTARRWLKKLNWRYTRKRNGMYIDGHEREDVVAYRKAFVSRWQEYEKRFIIYDNDGNVLSKPAGFPVPQIGRFRLILVTHDESTFYENNRCKTKWTHFQEKATTERKGEGPSIMVSEFLTPDWGWLKDGDDEARILFRAGKNRDGYFDNDDLISQVDHAIDIFEGLTNGFATGLFLFDNAPSHQKRAMDALSARKMPKNAHATWTHHKDGPKMRTTCFGEHSTIQDFYYPDDHPTMPGWFKGMENIIRERSLWPQRGLNAQCEGFKCEPGKTDCCCRRLLFTQPDFVNQKSRLEELITSHSHICDFYPKYHCELNFIEQYWGAAKLRYRNSPKTTDIKEMERNVLACLDDVPDVSIKRYANRAARFINGYFQGLTGPEAAWANRKYRGHRTLPVSVVAKLKEEFLKRFGGSK